LSTIILNYTTCIKAPKIEYDEHTHHYTANS
jgi:hypothetical protein